MEPFEVMTSESQERMLAIVRPEDLDEVLGICERWEVRASVVGTVTGSGRLRILSEYDGEVLADVPAKSLEEDAPLRPPPSGARRPRVRTGGDTGAPAPVSTQHSNRERLLGMLADTSWVWSQYDHQLFLNTVVGPGGDATVLRLKHPVPGSTRAGGWRSRPMATIDGVRPIPGWARRGWWPSRCSTWPAAAPGRWRSSTVSTSATPSTPR